MLFLSLGLPSSLPWGVYGREITVETCSEGGDIANTGADVNIVCWNVASPVGVHFRNFHWFDGESGGLGIGPLAKLEECITAQFETHCCVKSPELLLNYTKYVVGNEFMWKVLLLLTTRSYPLNEFVLLPVGSCKYILYTWPAFWIFQWSESLALVLFLCLSVASMLHQLEIRKCWHY